MLESPLQQLIRAWGFPQPVPQFVVMHDSRFIARVDFAWPERKVALEVDERVAHLSVAAFERDAARELALQAAGWTVVRVTAQVVRTEPAAAVRAISAALGGGRLGS